MEKEPNSSIQTVTTNCRAHCTSFLLTCTTKVQDVQHVVTGPPTHRVGGPD